MKVRVRLRMRLREVEIVSENLGMSKAVHVKKRRKESRLPTARSELGGSSTTQNPRRCDFKCAQAPHWW